jgi:D-sedoheptulose 7-phosphate isomerase
LAETLNSIASSLRASADVLGTAATDTVLHSAVEQAINAAIACLRAGGKILFCGNGGSAADSQHLAGELVSRFYYDRPGLPAFALTTDTSVLTAIGNDYGYDKVFARQVEAVGQPVDLLIAISTSGNSPSIILALEAARAKGMVSVGMTGRTGGQMAGKADVTIYVPSDSTPRIQEVHISIGHVICQLIEEAMFPK